MTSEKLTLFLAVVVGYCSSPLNAAERIYLMAGQSNMMGLSNTENLADSYKTTPANVSFYYKGSPRKLAQDKHFGPEVSFAHTLANTFPNDHHIIVKFAATGSHIRQWFPGEHYYQGMMRQLELAVPQENPRIDAIFWMQGEGDSFNLERASEYDTNLTYFIDVVRQELNAYDAPFIMGQIDPIGRDFPEVEIVQQMQQKVAASVDNTHLIPAQGIDKIYDNIHFSAAGQVEMGKRYAAKYLSLFRQGRTNSGKNQQ